MIDTTNYYVIALKAGVPTPDEGSAGADWLLRVAGAVEDVREYGDREEGIHEVADALVPVYTSQRFDIFHDLAAWDEDVADYGPFGTMEDQVATILYVIARRLLEALVAEEMEEMGE